jgi:hypothetical protein
MEQQLPPSFLPEISTSDAANNPAVVRGSRGDDA